MEPAVFDFWERVHAIREKDPRFRREAYEFVMRGLIDLARQDYGELAWTVFNEWGVTRSEDFGAIVFLLVEDGLLGRQDNDSPEDFHGGLDLKAELEPPARQRPLA